MAEGDTITVEAPEPEDYDVEPEPIPLDVLYEDADLLVIDKPAGMVVHPAAGNWHGTLVNAVLYHCPDLEGVGGAHRPGIVHRLDKDTSGLILVAKNDRAHRILQAQFKARDGEEDLSGAGLWSGHAGRRGSMPPSAATCATASGWRCCRPARAARGHALRDAGVLQRPGQPAISRCWHASRSPVAPTRFACTWPTSGIRSSAMRPMAANASRLRPVPASSCTPSACGSGCPTPAPRSSSARRCQRTCRGSWSGYRVKVEGYRL